MEKRCVQCGHRFNPNSNRQKFCSDCGRRGTGVCETCDKEFKLKVHTTGRWCSRECYLQRLDAELGYRPCPECGKEYKPHRREQMFCSRKCWKANTANRRTSECPVCGKVYTSRHYSGTCSRKCAAERQRLEPAGHNCERCGKLIPWPETKRFCSQECRGLPLGSVKVLATGYARVKVAPGGHDGGWVLQHRHVMELILGRTLEPHERVHHRNGIRADNRPENLELWKVTKKDPSGVRADDYHCAGCTCFDT